MPPFEPLDPDEICRRWHLAHAADCLMSWSALRHLFAAEAGMCLSSGLRNLCGDMTALSNLAHQHVLDLEPVREQESA